MAIGKRSRVSEEISLVQHQTLQTLRNAEPVDGRCDRILLVTSALPGEGKTFISLNLAASLAASGRAPVLLVDTDGKAGSVSQLLGADEEPGLRALASGEMTQRIDSFLLPTAQPQLFVLPYGKASVAHAKAPPGEMMAATVLRLSRALPDHIIVLDSPPCLSVSDPSSLAAIAGQVLMVVQAERTKRAELEAALDLVDSCPTLQLVLNQTRQVGTDSFGAYGDYGAHHRSVASDA
jgi:receptor protein-tyrosine kinase